MKLIERQMQLKETEQKHNYQQCQASINSDGCITIRNYDYQNKDQDEIIILSRKETGALIKLFSKISQITNNYNLPF